MRNKDLPEGFKEIANMKKWHNAGISNLSGGKV
jgi:hypothetical protein